MYVCCVMQGGSAVVKCRESYTKTLDDLIQLASLQTSLKTLDEALKVTNRRVNALEFVVLPQLNNTIKYIISELDEMEREDQYRIKKVKDIRTKQDEDEAEETEKLRKATAKAAREQEKADSNGNNNTDNADKNKKGKGKAKNNGDKKNNSILQEQQFAVDALLDQAKLLAFTKM